MPLWYRKITVMESFFNKVTGCHLTKKILHHSFFWMNFVNSSDQFVLKQIRANTSVSSVPLPVFFIRTVFWKIFSKVIRVASCEVTEERTSFGWIFYGIFQISFFLKQLWADPCEGLYKILPVFWKKSQYFCK